MYLQQDRITIYGISGEYKVNIAGISTEIKCGAFLTHKLAELCCVEKHDQGCFWRNVRILSVMQIKEYILHYFNLK